MSSECELKSRRLFDPNGIFWQVSRESVLLLGGGTALLMQLAHPKIAAAIADHSDFREHPIQRLYGTIKTMQALIYGDHDTSLAAIERVNHIHAGVYGSMREGTSFYSVGTNYSAANPELVLWVYATLIATTLKTYSIFVRRLALEEERAFYLESRIIAELFGADDTLIPQDLTSFHHYYSDMLSGPVLEITPTARALAKDIIHPPIRGFPATLGDVISVPTLALLPEQLRERYGFKWDYKRKLAWSIARRSIRRTLPFVPKVARLCQSARKAEQRLTTSQEPAGKAGEKRFS